MLQFFAHLLGRPTYTKARGRTELPDSFQVFILPKSSSKKPIRHFCCFGQKVLPDKSSYNGQKLIENANFTKYSKNCSFRSKVLPDRSSF